MCFYKSQHTKIGALQGHVLNQNGIQFNPISGQSEKISLALEFQVCSKAPSDSHSEHNLTV